VSEAFKNHLFCPSPPKKVAGIRRVLFPACASSSQWRNFHRQNIATKKFYKGTQQNNTDPADQQQNKQKDQAAIRKQPQSRKPESKSLKTVSTVLNAVSEPTRMQDEESALSQPAETSAQNDEVVVLQGNRRKDRAAKRNQSSSRK
jgi:hypothetical protein